MLEPVTVAHQELNTCIGQNLKSSMMTGSDFYPIFMFLFIYTFISFEFYIQNFRNMIYCSISLIQETTNQLIFIKRTLFTQSKTRLKM